MRDTVAVKRALAELAAPESERGGTASGEPPASSEESTAQSGERTPRATVERALTAVESVDGAAAFVADDGLDRLARAVEHVDDAALREDGRQALDTLRRLRAVARGDDHFHSGRGTVIRRREQGVDT